MTDQEFAVFEARMRARWDADAELRVCLEDIRALQKRRVRLEATLRQMQREAIARQAAEGGAA